MAQEEMNTGQGRPAAAPDESPRTPGYSREVPDTRVQVVGDHYIVKAGCCMGVFHTAREVEDFLHRLLVDWVNANLGEDRGILKVSLADLPLRKKSAEGPAEIQMAVAAERPNRR